MPANPARATRLAFVDTNILLYANEIMELTQFSFWDSLVIAAAEKSGAELLYSKDLQHGQRIAGLLIQNPFL